MRYLKKWTLTLLITLIALHSPAAFAVDTITPDTSAGQTAIVTYDWTSDGSGNASGRTSISIPGVILSAWTEPSGGGTAPTDDYDITIKNTFPALAGGGTYNTPSTDIVSSALLNRDTANAELLSWWPDTIYPCTGHLLISVSNAGAAKQGRIILAVARNLRIQAGEGSVPFTTGGTGDILQYLSPGAGKWVTPSGDFTMADGGAATVSAASAASFTVPLGVGYIGANDTTQGTWNLYGGNGASLGGRLRFYGGAGSSTVTDYYNFEASNLTFKVSLQGGSGGTVQALEIVAGNGDVHVMQNFEAYGNNPIFNAGSAGTTMDLGQQDVGAGNLRLWGHSNSTDSSITLYNGANNDTSIDAYKIYSGTGNFSLKSVGGTFGSQTLIDIDDADGETRFPYAYSLTSASAPNVFIDTDGAIKRSTASIATVTSGLFTPTAGTTVNVDSATNLFGFYQRSGNIVTYSFRMAINATASATETSIEIDLPIASNFAGVTDAFGSCVVAELGAAYGAGYVISDSVDDTIQISFTSVTNGSQSVSGTVQYEVL